jgi:hypothetical protein
LLVAKKDGSKRMTVDYRHQNNVTVKDAHPLPQNEEMFVKLSGARWFTKLDLFSGYYQIPMDPASAQFTAFGTEAGLYEYMVIPMGLTNAPATFQRIMNHLLADVIKKGFVVVYIDDILIFSESIEEHVEHVKQVIAAL